MVVMTMAMMIAIMTTMHVMMPMVKTIVGVTMISISLQALKTMFCNDGNCLPMSGKSMIKTTTGCGEVSVR